MISPFFVMRERTAFALSTLVVHGLVAGRGVAVLDHVDAVAREPARRPQYGLVYRWEDERGCGGAAGVAHGG